MPRAKRSRSNENVLKKFGFCIYCGGIEKAETVDHMPPIICFAEKARPKGLEFPSCKTCNNGAKHVDLIAGFFSRLNDLETPEITAPESYGLLTAIGNNIPNVLAEWSMHDISDDEIVASNPNMDPQGGLLEFSKGPITNKFLDVFSAKLGLALHYEISGRPLNPTGGIAMNWFSNYQKFTGQFPDDLMELFPEFSTLKNGVREVSSQFQYAWKLSEDKSFGAYFTSFRMSFATVAFVSQNLKVLNGRQPASFRIYTPAEIKVLISSLGNS